MSDKNNNAVTETVAALQGIYNAKLEVLGALSDTATAEQKQAAQTAVDEAKTLLDVELAKANKPADNVGKGKTNTQKTEKAKFVKGVFLLSPTGRFGLAYNAGEPADLESKQAVELQEAGYFRIENNS